MIAPVDLFDSTRAPQPKALGVTQLVRRMKNLLEIEIGEQWVEGEVSNLRKQGSGHWYFTLKDDRAQISCAIFGARRKPGAEVLADGAQVRVFAEPGIYEARGQLQIIVSKAEAVGRGDLQAKFEALKRKLDAEGLFAAERKRPLPPFPATIGLITSATGAAIRDMVNVFERRAPWVQLVLLPVRVQGRGAEREIAAAIARLGDPETHGLPACDLLIVGRGGGSLEDLWNFNEESVARAIAACPLPVVSAVGHEIDFTIADFAADLRAPTPSAAAELTVPDGAELRQRLQALERRMRRRAAERVAHQSLRLKHLRDGILARGDERLLREPAMRADTLAARLRAATEARFADRARRLDQLGRRLDALRPERRIALREQAVRDLRGRLARATQTRWRERVEHLHRLRDLLRALGPELAFERGFSITTDADGRILRSAAGLAPGQVLHTRLADGAVTSEVVAPPDDAGNAAP